MAANVTQRIRKSGLSIYDSLTSRPDLFISTETLQRILNRSLVGLNLDYALRTRSKIVKCRVCEVLGYPVPNRFKRTQPRFPGQNFDTYVQKANNLQIWNEDVSVSRRYVLIRLNESSVVTKVRVVTGDLLSRLDATGTLTHKYQAKARVPVTGSLQVSHVDTPNVVAKLIAQRHLQWPAFMQIADVFNRLRTLVGTTIPNAGKDQERGRGWAMHEAACRRLGMRRRTDHGQFPDVPEQLLEIKLQTGPTIDLGLVCPDSTEPAAISAEIRHCDIRYAVVYGTLVPSGVRLDHVVLITGAEFFTYFRRFEGKVRNVKIQIPLPLDFFR